MGLAVRLIESGGGGGGLRTASGTITGVANGTTIAHNLGTQKIIGIIYPLGNTYVADANGRAIVKIFCNMNAVVGASISCDFSRYNSIISKPYIYTPETSWALVMNGPNSTGTSVANARSTVNSGANADTYTDNTVKILGLSVGQEYIYKIFVVE